jgi:hypothetical protein
VRNNLFLAGTLVLCGFIVWYSFRLVDQRQRPISAYDRALCEQTICGTEAEQDVVGEWRVAKRGRCLTRNAAEIARCAAKMPRD